MTEPSDTPETPDYDDVADALFETLAALTDLQERLAGGAVRSGVPPEQVINEVWAAYDLDAASTTLQNAGYERADAVSPEDWAIDERVRVPREEEHDA